MRLTNATALPIKVSRTQYYLPTESQQSAMRMFPTGRLGRQSLCEREEPRALVSCRFLLACMGAYAQRRTPRSISISTPQFLSPLQLNSFTLFSRNSRYNVALVGKQ